MEMKSARIVSGFQKKSHIALVTFSIAHGQLTIQFEGVRKQKCSINAESSLIPSMNDFVGSQDTECG